ncbi:hypothetical protein [uncultured Tenacibaculum sp.]|uniref:hypothetical protein n=1 Tax=uncultured Tenacibaculum sp. TaxID=174713 RepID=UPI002637037F|nr:hypothetical protein [uncultured Tenacibaculum sp.]
MKIQKKKIFFLIGVLIIIPFSLVGQIPDGHFIDADKSEKKGYKLKPFIQKDKGIYHYAVLTELPFDNKCKKGISQKKQIDCSEKRMSELIIKNIKTKIDYKGDVYVYLTVNSLAKAVNVEIKAYPKSDKINRVVREAVELVKFKPGKYKDKIVDSRIWAVLKF